MMEVDQSTYLLDLPNEVLEKVVHYLPSLVVHKNFRSTCKRLYYLCKKEKRFHPDEVIVWSAKSKFHIASFYENSARCCFNLIFSGVTLNVQQVSRFFTEHGAKVQSLSFINCKSAPGLLESIIVQCEAVSSLSIKHVNGCSFSFESASELARPTVIFLELVLDSIILQQSPNIFYRISHLFPCVKHLSIESDEKVMKKYHFMNLVIFDFVVNFSHLESLKFNVNIPTLYFNAPKFLDLLPKLETLYLSLDSYSVENDTYWNIFASRSKASSIELYESDVVYAWHIEPLLSMTSLKHLSYSASEMYFTLRAFNILVSSQLEKICFHCTHLYVYGFETDLPSNNINETVSDLIFYGDSYNSRIISLFAVHFRGLVHVEIGDVSDCILKKLFKHLKNLRSLVLQNCQDCSKNGFCGENTRKLVNSIKNLQNLEHLSIKEIEPSVLQTKIFQRAFKFPRLKYLRISLTSIRTRNFTETEIPVNMLKSCVSLEALSFGHFSTPSSTILSSLFQNLKRLNYLYLHFLISEPEQDHFPLVDRSPSQCTYVNLKHFPSADLARLLSTRNANAYYHYDEDLDLTVFTNKIGRTVTLTSPKFGFYTVDWINVE